VVPVTPDAMRHLLAWTAAAGITDGPLFRAVLKGGRTGGALDAGDVGRIFKGMARAAALTGGETARISGHSTRVGAAQDMLRYGEALPAIMPAGRWKAAEMVSRYTARQGARQSAAVRVADRRVPF
jgi:integrase